MSTGRMIALYDDRLRLADDACGFMGVDRFARIVYRKKTLQAHAQELMDAAGATRFIPIEQDGDLERLLAAGPGALGDTRVVYLPSCIVSRNRDAARIFFRKFAYSHENFVVRPEGASHAPPVLVMDANATARLMRERLGERWRAAVQEPGDAFQWIDNQAGLVDLTKRDNLIDFISSTFDVRHFNAIEQDSLVVTKRSSDIDKMRREYRFYEQLSGAIRLFFLQPLSFREEGGTASYQTERICVPDMAVQWIHHAFDEAAFTQFLDKLRGFLEMRPARPAAGDSLEALYLGKIRARVRQLQAMKQYPAIADALRHGSGTGDLDAAVARYQRTWERLASRRRAPRQTVSHGDLCFSNILYHRQSRLMKFIDPRGAESADDLYLDEYYDLAKLSHSILGGYDFVNHDLYDLRVGAGLRLELDIAGQGVAPLQAIFRRMIELMGFDPVLVRLYEASLFLSMLPLHADNPRKVVAFVLIAERIMDELERGS